jgi:PAS domain S-box-containing protein
MAQPSSVQGTERREGPIEIDEKDSPYYDTLVKLFENEPEPIGVVDLGGRAIYGNPALWRLTDSDREAVIGTTAPFPWWHPEEALLRSRILETLIPELLRETGVATLATHVHRPDGEVIYAHLVSRPSKRWSYPRLPRRFKLGHYPPR